MRAVAFDDGTPVVIDLPDPAPGDEDVLIRVRGAGLNGADMLQRRGRYAPPPGAPETPGLELAGEVVGTGARARRFAPGDRVMAVVAGGGQAELATVHERLVLRVPEGWDWPTAGGFPETFTTAHDALFTQCHLTVGERLCVHGAAGGVGVSAVQLGVAAGAEVVATVRDPARRDAVAALGATVVDPAEFTEHGPFDVVLELVGAPNLPADLASLATGGRIAVIGVGAGAKVELDLLALMAARGRIHGSTLRARSLEEKAAAARLVERQVLPLASRVHVPIEATYALDDVAAAYDRFAAGGKLGKIVLLPSD
jgi:NADPH:quinone reductase-like Zn-dependent oxidoreductase